MWIPKSVLVVCVGNTCRSPLAEYLLRYYAQHTQHPRIQAIKFNSAGLHGGKLALAPRTREFLAQKGIFVNGFTSKLTTNALFHSYDMILVMEPYMKPFILKHYYQKSKPVKRQLMAEKIHIITHLGELPIQGIEDPYLQDDLTYHRVIQQIEEACQTIIKRWATFTQKPWYHRWMIRLKSLIES